MKFDERINHMQMQELRLIHGLINYEKPLQTFIIKIYLPMQYDALLYLSNILVQFQKIDVHKSKQNLSSREAYFILQNPVEPNLFFVEDRKE